MSKVVVVKLARRDKIQQPTKDEYQQLLSAGLPLLAGNSSIVASITNLIPKGVVGMKTNCLSPKMTFTPPNLSHALAEVLIESGRRDNDVVIWERTNRELKRAGYDLNASVFGVRCLGTDTKMVGYSDDLHSFGEVASRVSRILTDMVDFNINLPVLKDHSIAGISGGLKNMYGAIHNPNKYHGDNCNPFAAQVSSLEPIRERQALTVIDAINVQYHGGPAFNEAYMAPYGGLIISADPVAADRVGLEIIEHLRGINGQPTLAKAGRPVKYLQTAEEIGLGVADIGKIAIDVAIMGENGDTGTGELF